MGVQRSLRSCKYLHDRKESGRPPTAAMALKAALANARAPIAETGRECEFADAGSCRPAARCRHRQQSAPLLTYKPGRLTVSKGRLTAFHVASTIGRASAVRTFKASG
jgi:hypothetical protein